MGLHDFVSRFFAFASFVLASFFQELTTFPSLPPSSPQAISSNAAMVHSTLRVFPLPASLLKPAHAVELGKEECLINDAAVTVYVTRPTISLCEESILKVAGGEGGRAAGVSGFVASMDYEKLREEGREGGGVVFVLDGEEVRLRVGEHYFLSATERARAKDLLPELVFLSVSEGEGEGEGGNGGEKK